MSLGSKFEWVRLLRKVLQGGALKQEVMLLQKALSNINKRLRRGH